MMTFHFFLLLLITEQPNEDPLQKYRWENRILLIFRDHKETSRATTQMRLFEKEKDGFVERDLLFFLLSPDEKAGNPFSLQEEKQIRKRFNPGDQPFLVVLIGKDGGKKLSTEEILTIKELFDTIDAMPMRRSEMRRKQ